MYNKTTQTDNNPASDGNTMVNLDYMDMMSDGDADMKKVMLEMLLEEIPQELQKMREVHTSADWNGLASVSHKMKSTLAFVGNDAMTSANKELESIGKTQDGTDRVSALIDVLEKNATPVLVELKKVLDGL
jgi:HPt (histidine-containing phosphotransfer) domain-containing protein